MTEHIKIKCDDCKFVEECVDYGWDECKKFTPKPSEPMTNEEWLRSATTEQLAEFLYDIAYFDNWSDAIMNDSLINETAVEDAIEKWLKQPHHEKE